MERTISRDGTPIAYHRIGSGPPLVLVHGGSAANPVVWPAFPGLAEHFTLYAMDRRGRRESGDADTYALEREFEDVAAVVDAVGAPAYLLGHSFGALCALEVPFYTDNVQKLILYEPPVPGPGLRHLPEGLGERLKALLRAGDRDRMLTALYRTAMSPDEVEQLRSSRAWADRLAAAHTVPREVRAFEAYIFDPERFADLETPTVLLIGGESPPTCRAAAEMVDAALPHSEIVEIPGQRHLAMYMAPDLFVDQMVRLLAASE